VWLPVGFAPPSRVDLPTGHHLRPIRERDTPIDYPAVMGSRDKLWAIFGEHWGWPPADMTFEQDQADLARHEREQHTHESFNYAVWNDDESALFGCVYVDPPESDDGQDADIAWWTVDGDVGRTIEACLETFVPDWISSAWPFARPRFFWRTSTDG
jgi:hypothetical protein